MGRTKKSRSQNSDDESDEVSVKNTLPDVLCPAMMTVCVYLKNRIDLDFAFWCLPCVEDEELLTRRAPKRARFKKLGDPGTIWSLWYGSYHRGLDKDNKVRAKSQGNSIEVDMSIQEKNVNLRIFRELIHVVGMSSHEMVTEVITYIKDHLENLQAAFKLFKEETEILTLMLKECKGEIDPETGKHELLELKNPIPQMSIFDGIFPLCDTWEGFNQFVRYCMSNKYVISRSFKIEKSHDSTAVYSYYLGFRISPRKIAKYAKRKYRFFTTYDKGTMRSAKLELAVSLSKLKDRPFKKGAKKPRHTFTIQKSGHVKQVSPTHELGLRAFAKFEKLINKIQDVIQEETESSDSDSEV